MRIEEAKDRVVDVWRDSAEATLCLALVDLLAKHASAMDRVTFALIHRVANENNVRDEKVVAEVVQFLIGHDLHLLDPVYEYIDDRDRVYVISYKDMKATFSTGEFYPPESNEADPDFEDKIFLSFVPSVLARGMAATQ
ncbi:hypothetical protein [Paraburkholderia tropica]|uniref:hypothetical protein n=1 Tax=Paraburkholderia tropica TaxID=92647 RepID=UPI002AB30CE5|nr:hypothetical protein [Paraburkholderia tropica]